MNRVSGIDGRRILITGGTGFIGGRLVEVLKSTYDVEVRVLVSGFTNVARIARYPVDMARGDVCSLEDVRRAAEGCDLVFHCAYGSRGTPQERRSVNVEGTRNVLEACLASGVGRLVYLSTMMVYGDTLDGEIDETSPRQLTGSSYGDSKLEAEQLVLDYHRQKGLSTTVLQPTAVYGPFAKVWSEAVLEELKSGKVALIDGGIGVCNGVYIDDVVQAMLLSAVSDAAEGEAFIVSGSDSITWREFYGYFEEMLGTESTESLSEAEALARAEKRKRKKGLLDALRENPELRTQLGRTPVVKTMKRAATTLLPGPLSEALKQRVRAPARRMPSGAALEQKPVHPVSEWQIRFFKSKARFSIHKARTVLGYNPEYDYESGMLLTAKWAEWSNRLGKEEQQIS